jgi:hypothetical protein
MCLGEVCQGFAAAFFCPICSRGTVEIDTVQEAVRGKSAVRIWEGLWWAMQGSNPPPTGKPAALWV